MNIQEQLYEALTKAVTDIRQHVQAGEHFHQRNERAGYMAGAITLNGIDKSKHVISQCEDVIKLHLSSPSIPSVGMLEEIHGLISNANDNVGWESDKEESEYFDRLADTVCSIAQKHIQEDAVAFAEWIDDNKYERYPNGEWEDHDNEKVITTAELYKEYEKYLQSLNK